MTSPTSTLRRYLGALDRGEVIAVRVVQIAGEDVRVAAGPGAFWARARGGRPRLGYGRMEVVRSGSHPVFRMLGPRDEGTLDLIVDASREKAADRRGSWIDERA